MLTDPSVFRLCPSGFILFLSFSSSLKASCRSYLLLTQDLLRPSPTLSPWSPQNGLCLHRSHRSAASPPSVAPRPLHLQVPPVLGSGPALSGNFKPQALLPSCPRDQVQLPGHEGSRTQGVGSLQVFPLWLFRPLVRAGQG